MRALLNHGADPNHSDHCGRNAIKVAAKSGHDTVVRLLEEYSANQRSLRPGVNGGTFVSSPIPLQLLPKNFEKQKKIVIFDDSKVRLCV